MSDVSRSQDGNGKKKRGLTLLCLVIGLSLIGFAIWYFAYGRFRESTDDAFIDGHVVVVSARVGGHVQRVFVKDNQPVKAGDLLLELDPADYQVKLDQARSALAAAIARNEAAVRNVAVTQKTTTAAVALADAGRAAMEAARNTVRSRLDQAEAALSAVKAMIAQANAQAQAAETEARKAHDDTERLKGLFQKGAISRQQMDHATAAETSAMSMWDAARRHVAVVEAQAWEASASREAAVRSIAQSDAAIHEAVARVEAATSSKDQIGASQAQAESMVSEVNRLRASVREAELTLSYTRVTASVDGWITRRSVEAGNVVTPGQPMLAVVPSDVWVVANFKETQIHHMRPGQPVDIDVDAFPGTVFHGEVDSIQAGTGSRFSLLPPENATGNFVKIIQRVPVKIRINQPENGQYRLVPGMSVVPVVNVRR